MAVDVNSNMNFSGKYFKLTQPIKLSGAWTPIGNRYGFSGTFDGGGFEISGLSSISTSSADYPGLFGQVIEGTVKNLGVDGTVNGTGNNVGGVVGYNMGGTVENCYYTGDVSGSSWVGGVVGYNEGGTVENCYNTGTVNGTDSHVGGVVGFNKGTVENCYNTGTVIGTGNYYVGGVVGGNGNDYVTISCTVENCYNTGSVTGNNSVGGVAGQNTRYSTVQNCYYLKDSASKGIGINYSSTDTVTQITEEDFADQDTFAGWEFTNTWVMSDWLNRPVLKNNCFTVTLDHNDGEHTEDHYVDYGSNYGTLPTLTRDGYDFDGWFTEKTDGSKVTSNSGAITSSHTLYAQWTKLSNTVTFDYQDGRASTTEEYDPDAVYGDTLPKPSRTGYDFGGWFKDPNCKGEPVKSTDPVEDSHTLYAKWTANTYTVTFEYNGADGGDITEKTRSVTYDSEYGALPTPTKTGHTFEGWFTEESGGSKVESDTIVKITDAEGQTLYARWTAKTYNVTLIPNDGVIANENNYTSYTYGVGLTLPTPTKTGYDFGGWYKESDLIGSPVMAISATDTGDKTYYAKWDTIEYNIGYILNGGEVTGNPDTYTIESSSITLNEPVRTGYTFDGWSGTGITGTSKSVTIAAGSTGDREYTANWTPDQYTVTFDYQGATSGYERSSITVTYDSTYGGLPTPKKTGFSFGGWFTEENGQGDEITADIKVKITAAQTLYASWIECQHEDMKWNDNGDGEHHSGTCENCEKFVQDEHHWNDGEITLEPTAETEGEKLFTCGDCDATYTEVIPKHEHDFGGAWEGYDKNGHWHICPVDKATDTPIAHNWNDGEVTKEATETEEGELTYTCDDCGAVKTQKTEKLPPTDDGSDGSNDSGGGNTGDDNNGDSKDDKDSGSTSGGSSGGTSRPSTGTTTPSTGDSSDPSDSTSDPSTGDTTDPSTGDSNDPTGDTTEPSTDDNNDPSEDNSDPSTGDSTDPSDGNSAGNVNVDSASGENAPDVSISEETSSRLKDEVIASHLTPEEKTVVANGDDDIDVILLVEDAGDTVPAEDKQVTEAVLTNTGYTLGMYLNIDLIKLINGQQVGKITEINSPINVTIEIPEELRSANRDFAIVRVHDGVAEILEDVDDDPDTITIITDKFSTYSIAYQDTDANPNTGVATPIAILAISCAVIVATVAVKKRKIIE